MSHNEIIERARDRALVRALKRMAQSCEVGLSVPEAFVLIYEEVTDAFFAGVNAKADAMMATQEVSE